MILSKMTWKEVDAISRDTVVLFATGSCEQHGGHLPLFTDSILATAVAESVAQKLSDDTLLAPTFWLGASGHHLPFAGTISSPDEAYINQMVNAIEGFIRHGFWKFYIINGHGGNQSVNDLALRRIKMKFPQVQCGHSGYYSYAAEAASKVLEGPSKTIMHSCEAEVSLMLHISPELVREDLLVDDGYKSSALGMVYNFDEITDNGSLGYATLATAEKGKTIFDAAVDGLMKAITWLRHDGTLEQLPPKS